MKLINYLVISLVLFASCSPPESDDQFIDILQQGDQGNQFDFELSSNGYILKSPKSKNMTVANIPATYKGKPVTSIGSGAFYDYSSLTSVIIPNSVTSIGGSSFGLCASLTSIIIPQRVTSIGDRAFEHCSRLSTVTVLATTPPELIFYVFYGCSALTTIYVPNLSTYRDTENWGSFGSKLRAIP